MGLKPDFLEAFASTVMEHEKLQITDATMLLKEQESSVFNIGSPQIVHKTGQHSDVKLNGLPNKDPTNDVNQSSSDVQRPLHVQVNGFGKAPAQPLSSSSAHGTHFPPSPAPSRDDKSATSSLGSAKALVSPPPVPSPSSRSKTQPPPQNPPGITGASGPLLPNATTSRREVEVTRRKTVVDKINKGREHNAFTFFVSGFESQTATQLAMAARRLKSVAEEKMPRHMVTKVFGEDEARIVKKRSAQVQLPRPRPLLTSQEYDDSTDLSDIEVKEKVETVVTKYGLMKATMSYKMAENSMQIENISRQVEDLDGFLCVDGQVPSCSAALDPQSCARIRPVDVRYTLTRRNRYTHQFRAGCAGFGLNQANSFGTTGACALNMAQVTCPPLRYAEAFARMASMNPAFAIRSRIDVPFWLNREAIGVERRRCAPVQFDDAEEIERGQTISKSKKMRMNVRSSVSSTDSSSIEDSEEERKDKSYTAGGYSEKRRHEIRRARNKKKQRRRARRLLGVESDTESDSSIDSYFKVRVEMPKYSDIEVPRWRKLSNEELAAITSHPEPCSCCSSTRLETLVARKHLRLANEERLYFEGKRREMPSLDSDDNSEVEGADLTPLLQCTLTESERALYDRSAQAPGGREALQKPR
ncbi:hypothetical protein NECAME_00851 [Necator americanus]|uniref:Uncharacterized protein n=1 Tax=Necator americanus TaxID=51031 RepID=W2SR34_NECAM|nr:hypothetical protein NECAME_00851 [Necator americanus]ETN71162.1 hypothetical protein NECAME_00851 [Necator americanus]